MSAGRDESGNIIDDVQEVITNTVDDMIEGLTTLVGGDSSSDDSNDKDCD